MNRDAPFSRVQQRALDENVGGWLLLALREAMGDPGVRNAILQKHMGTTVKRVVEFGRTFEAGFTLKQLESYLTTIVAPKKKVRYLLFTAQNLPDKRSGETHYQTFILDYPQKSLWVMDPARTPTGKGIYRPFIALDVVIPFFKEREWTTEFAPTSSACQKGVRDVFCQSWSLFLQIEFLKMLLEEGSVHTLDIPSKKEERYLLLVQFLQKALAIPKVCDQVSASYTHLIQSHPNLVQGASTQQQKKRIRDTYLAVSPCLLLSRMTVHDLV